MCVPHAIDLRAQNVIEVLKGDDCSSWRCGLTSNDLGCLTKEQWLTEKVLFMLNNDILHVYASYYIVPYGSLHLMFAFFCQHKLKK